MASPGRAVIVELTAVFAIVFYALAVVAVGFGLVGLAAPGQLRRHYRYMAKGMPARVGGFVWVLLGMLLFAVAGRTGVALPLQIIGAALFVAGGVVMVVPDVASVALDPLTEAHLRWYRLIGVGYFLFAALLFFAGRTMAPIAEVTPVPPA
jgi:hypothetical protein